MKSLQIKIRFPGSLWAAILERATLTDSTPTEVVVGAVERDLGGKPASRTPIQDNIDANGGRYVGPEVMRFPKYRKPTI